MKFKNNGTDVQVRIKEKNIYMGEGFRWQIVRTNEVVDLEEETGRVYGFEKINVTEGQIGKVKVETKQIENDFFKELCSIKGIGVKTAKDIIRTFPNREDLKNKIQKMENLPFRDDVEKLLREKYG